MTWERFGYICRKASIDYQDQESISDCLTRIEQEKFSNLYGKKISRGSWPGRLLEQIREITDKSSAQRIMGIYSDLKLTQHFEEPMRFKRAVAYLSYVTFVFFIVVGIYQLKVAPSFLEVFDNFDQPVPSYLRFYGKYWGYFTLVVLLTLLLSLAVGFKLKSLFRLGLTTSNDFLMRFLILPSIQQSYANIVCILRFPIASTDPFSIDLNIPISTHLAEVKASKMCLTTEMQELIKIEMRSLLENSEKQMKYISITVALIIVAAIYFFLASAYSPIFILGETI